MANYRPNSSVSGSRKSPNHFVSAPSMASSSASSSQAISPIGGSTTNAGVNRNDQIIHRIYLKTVGVLVDGRLTHHGDERSERKKDKWFNIVIPDVDIHKADLQVYKSISTFSTTSDDTSAVPPLLVAFILDTSDIPSNQALLWSRGSSRETLDTGRIAKGKGKETRSGIVLERWTFQASAASDTPSGSQIAAHTAYRMGIIHFRALYSLLRTLPAYRLHRKLRRSTNGLRLGLKLWAPEGYPNTEKGLQEAWDVMEQGLVGIDTGLDTLVDSLDIEPDQDTRRYDLPSLDLFGNEYRLSVNYRPEIDIHVEDLESVLSEKFVDMEEDWFTPTVARHRMGEGSIPSSVASASSNPPSRRVGTPTTMPSSNPAPIPQRQGPASIGSFQSGMVPGSRSRQASAQRAEPVVSERWGSIGEGLPFATGTTNQDIKGSPSSMASGAAVAARRLSGHSIHPFTSASPSTSNLRGSPTGYTQGPSPTLAPRPIIAHSSSIGRTSSFLSQSGRSFTHAQLAHMYPGSASPPVTGVMSREHLPLDTSSDSAQPVVSPTSLSFSKQPLPRSSGRQPSYNGPGMSPFIPSSLERDNSMPPPSAPSLSKRYSSSLSTSQGQRARVSSYGSSVGEGASLSGPHGHNLLRRSSTRMSTESGLRHSLEAPDPPYQTTDVPDNDDIQSFLKTLEALPQPPSLAAQAASSRIRQPSASSSLSNNSIPQSPSLLHAPYATSSGGFSGRAPVTRAQVDDAVRRMTGSFVANTKTLEQSSIMPSGSSTSTDISRAQTPASRAEPAPGIRQSSVGLLTASRPLAAPRRVSPASLAHPPEGSPMGRSSSVKKNSPLSGAPFQPPTPITTSPDPQAVETQLPPSPPIRPVAKTAARSLPAGSALEVPPVPVPASGYLSPQPTGVGRSGTSQRRGPVLLRGGFEGRSQSQFTTGSTVSRHSTSPSRSPIRDFSRLGTSPGPRAVNSSSVGGIDGERQAEAELKLWRGKYKSDQRVREGSIQEGSEAQVQVEGQTVRRQSTGAGSILDHPTTGTTRAQASGQSSRAGERGQSRGQGQRTAPSSLGRYRDQGSDSSSSE